VIILWRGLGYRLDLARCNRALLELQIEGRFDGIAGLADSAGVSRSTASRFMGGKGTSPTTTRALLKELGLKWEEVVAPQDGEVHFNGPIDSH
jgi:hypothetical protein